MTLEMFKDHVYRVVWSDEEKAKSLAEGWSETREDGVLYRPITAPAPVMTPAAVEAHVETLRANLAPPDTFKVDIPKPKGK